METKKQDLLNIIKSYLNGTPISGVENWNKLLFLAKKHSLSSIFYFAIKDLECIPIEIKEMARKRFDSELVKLVSQEYYASQIFSTFRKEKLRFLPLKGWVLRKYYPNPEGRSSCDVDVYYDESQIDKVEKVLGSFGFQKDSENIIHAVWTRDMVTIELHHTLAEDEKTAEYYKDLWGRLTTKDNCEFAFSNEDFYIYMIVHAAKHFNAGGFGIRTVLDVYVFNQKETLDKNYLDCELKKLGLSKFESVLRDVSNTWFNDVPCNENIKLIEEYIFNCGTYGASSNATIYGVAQKGEKISQMKRRHVIQSLFPSYRYMKIRYPILKKIAVLLPFFWIVRWLEALFKRKEKLRKSVSYIKAINNENVEKAIRIKEIVGL